jgi:hypothetical protein
MKIKKFNRAKEQQSNFISANERNILLKIRRVSLYILDLIYKSYGHALQFASELYCKEANH